jgi:hypothetical protein
MINFLRKAVNKSKGYTRVEPNGPPDNTEKEEESFPKF